eukprot:gnl/TRDRNA2_/TRDRNA2_177988_c0_seq6.p2 gnl/TRDRNA2_/TRDRNA2_177988_c0~~gnl/TRDRNA2_/TRDRNA2_177988_c0_seq6.p2  ORF type:complete len:287 (+),score=-19.40 gnl/TRDRNA2_/TRDRNA2_177988_c0_seq6:2053-2913(+)
MIRCFEIAQLSMKVERHLGKNGIDFQLLSNDTSKMAILCADRTVIIQARHGTHAKLRFPKQGRDIAYLPFTADLVVVGSAPKLYRMNLLAGKFMTPLSSHSPAINSCAYSKHHGLLACAGEDGCIECYDMRIRNSLGYVDVATSIEKPGIELTAVRYDDSGLYLGVGTSMGQVVIYDLRSSKPLIINDHKNGNKIVDIKFQKLIGEEVSATKVISSDTDTVKIWSLYGGQPYTNIKVPKESGIINDVCIFSQTGLIMLALESPNILPYYVPLLGPPPIWCPFVKEF